MARSCRSQVVPARSHGVSTLRCQPTHKGRPQGGARSRASATRSETNRRRSPRQARPRPAASQVGDSITSAKFVLPRTSPTIAGNEARVKPQRSGSQIVPMFDARRSRMPAPPAPPSISRSPAATKEHQRKSSSPSAEEDCYVARPPASTSCDRTCPQKPRTLGQQVRAMARREGRYRPLHTLQSEVSCVSTRLCRQRQTPGQVPAELVRR